MRSPTALMAALFVAGQLGLSAVPDAAAQERYPVRPVRLLVPYPPGGGADFTARELGHKLSEVWGQQVVADNRPGAATAIGHNTVAKAAPDGYTLGLGSPAGMALNPVLGTKLPYESPKDFTALGMIVSLPFVVAVSATLPANTMRELIALAKTQPGKLNFASPGIEPMTSTPENMQRFIVDEQTRWRTVIRSAGITADVMR